MPEELSEVAEARDEELSDGLGERLRNARNRRGLSLRDLASRVDVTAGFLSQLERSHVAPSISTLRRICDELGMTVIDALIDETRAASVVRADHRHKLVSPDHDVDMEVLVSEASRPFDMLLVRLAPGGATDQTLKAHDAREAFYVISGKATVEFADAHEHLAAGDTIFFSSSTPHRVVNNGRSDLTFISCIAGKY